MELLDGAIGTELAARGVRFAGRSWSAEAMTTAPDVLASIHRDYAAAGATLHTANTFRTQPGTGGQGWEHGLSDAIAIARQSVAKGQCVLGSLAPVEDCYRPDLSPGRAALGHHEQVSTALATAGCDVILCETFIVEAEALAAVEAALQTDKPVWLALTAGPDGDLARPADLGGIGKRAADLGAARLLANCIAATKILPYVEALAGCGVPIGVYANAGSIDDGIGWGDHEDGGPARYAELATQWVEAGATVLGGCCGTGPAHIRALRERFCTG